LASAGPDTALWTMAIANVDLLALLRRTIHD